MFEHDGEAVKIRAMVKKLRGRAPQRSHAKRSLIEKRAERGKTRLALSERDQMLDGRDVRVRMRRSGDVDRELGSVEPEARREARPILRPKPWTRAIAERQEQTLD